MEKDLFTPEWFEEKAKEFNDKDMQAKSLYDNFRNKFAPSKLKDLSDENLLNTLFLHGNNDNMCYELEYVDNNNKLFGSISSGTAFKYPLFKSQDGIWKTGYPSKPIKLSLSDAIIKASTIRDELVNSTEFISTILQFGLPLNIEQYLSFYESLNNKIPDSMQKIWVIKYYHMIFPNLIPTFYNDEWQTMVLELLKIKPSKTIFGRLGQINAFVRKCGISNVVFNQIFNKYCLNYKFDIAKELISNRLTPGENIILYGVPGSGKSWTIKHKYCNDNERMERIVFHPDYNYSDFVGQILPKIKEDSSVSYEFVPGPFTNLVRKAYDDPTKKYFLIIEELNRGNAPAIFGDIFQLLDRNKDGSSEYEITNNDVAQIVYGDKNHKVSIPSNMSIICTMNTSDQNVFTLDTAFQRRWHMKLIENKFRGENGKQIAKTKILDTDVTWGHFVTSINDIILSKNIRITSSEDKRLGTNFIGDDDLKYVENKEEQNSRFPEKVLKYLWDDVFKFNKEDIFDLNKVKSLEDVVEIFVTSEKNDRLKVFKENIYDTLVNKKNQ